MANYLLDTNHLSPLITIGHPLRKKVFQYIRRGHSFAICVPVLTEMLYGIGTLRRAKQNLAEWGRIKYNFHCYIPDESDAEQAARLRILLRRRGWQLAAMDALIGTICLRYDLILLTTDKDFRGVPLLKHENWLKP